MKKEFNQGLKRYLQTGNPSNLLNEIRKEIRNQGYSENKFAIKISMKQCQLRNALIYSRNPTIKTLRKILNGLDFSDEL